MNQKNYLCNPEKKKFQVNFNLQIVKKGMKEKIY